MSTTTWGNPDGTPLPMLGPTPAEKQARKDKLLTVMVGENPPAAAVQLATNRWPNYDTDPDHGRAVSVFVQGYKAALPAPDATSVSGPSTRAELLQSARTGLAVLECEIERCCDMLAGYVDPVPVTDAESAMNTPLEALVQAACHALAAAPASVTAEVLRYEVQCRKHGTAEWFNACLADTEEEGLTLLDEVAKRWEGHASRLVSLTLHKEVRALSPIEQGLPAPASVTSPQNQSVGDDELAELADAVKYGPRLPLELAYDSDEDGVSAYLLPVGGTQRHAEGDYCELAIFNDMNAAELVAKACNALPGLLARLAASPASVTSPQKLLVNDAERQYMKEIYDTLPVSMSDFLHVVMKRVASVTSPQNPWGDEPWEQYLERQREKGRSLQTTISALKSEVERNAKQIAETIAPISYHPNYDDTELDTLVQAACHQLKQALAASVTSPVEPAGDAFKAKFKELWGEAREMAWTNYGEAWAHLANTYDMASTWEEEVQPAALTSYAGGATAWILADEQLPVALPDGRGFSADVLCVHPGNPAPFVAYYDHRAGYKCWQTYSESGLDAPVEKWQPIILPATDEPR